MGAVQWQASIAIQTRQRSHSRRAAGCNLQLLCNIVALRFDDGGGGAVVGLVFDVSADRRIADLPDSTKRVCRKLPDCAEFRDFLFLLVISAWFY